MAQYISTLKAYKNRPNWTIRSIGGTALPILPKTVRHEVWAVDRGSYEDTNGNLVRTYLGDKDKFILTFPAMSQDVFEDIVALIKSDKFTVVYEDYFEVNKTHSGLFYRGDTAKDIYMMFGAGEYLYDEGFVVSLIPYNVRKP